MHSHVPQVRRHKELGWNFRYVVSSWSCWCPACKDGPSPVTPAARWIDHVLWMEVAGCRKRHHVASVLRDLRGTVLTLGVGSGITSLSGSPSLTWNVFRNQQIPSSARSDRSAYVFKSSPWCWEHSNTSKAWNSTYICLFIFIFQHFDHVMKSMYYGFYLCIHQSPLYLYLIIF